jgi:MoaA/NifB/PqqE/SkfB family radical SAM enzyme
MIAYDGKCCFRGSSNGTLPRVLWELNTTCNLNCNWCHAKPHVSKGISTVEVEDGLKLLKKWGVRGVIFSGGEPFLRKDILHLIKFSASLGVEVDICTNGTLINKQIARDLSGVLSEKSVSIDSANPLIHNQLRGTPGAWEKAVAGIGYLKQAGLEIHSISVLCRETLANVEDTIAFSESMGVHSMTLLGMIKFSDSDEYPPINKAELKIFEENLKIWRKKFNRIVINTKRIIQHGSADYCGAGDSIWGIDADGNLLSCILAKGKGASYPIGSLKNMSGWDEISQVLFKTHTGCVFPLTN